MLLLIVFVIAIEDGTFLFFITPGKCSLGWFISTLSLFDLLFCLHLPSPILPSPLSGFHFGLMPHLHPHCYAAYV